jgi:hypothetical protein
MAGSDKAFELMRRKKGFYPVQRATCFFSEETEEEFSAHADEFAKRVIEFKSRLPRPEPIEYTKPELLKYVQLRVYPRIKRIDLYINHENLGGPDYIELVTRLIDVEFNDLARDNLPAPVRWTYSMSFLLKCVETYCKPANICVPTTKILYTMKVPLKSAVRTKYVIIHEILSKTIAASPRPSLTCWIPISFERTKAKAAVNNVGVILFCFRKGMSVGELSSEIEGNKHTVMGSKNLMDSFASSTEAGQEKNTHLKKRVDVVLSMLHTKPTGVDPVIKPDLISVYFGKEMATDYNFPLYIFSITVGDTIHVTNSVSVPDFDTRKLCRDVGGKILP